MKKRMESNKKQKFIAKYVKENGFRWPNETKARMRAEEIWRKDKHAIINKTGAYYEPTLLDKFKKRNAKLFRKLIDIADEIDIWVAKTFNKHPKQATLEAVQDRTTRKNFDETIGKALGTKRK